MTVEELDQPDEADAEPGDTDGASVSAGFGSPLPDLDE